MKKAFDFFTEHPARFFLLAASAWGGIMFFINRQQGITWKEIFVEANGMAFDLLVFGVLLSVYEVLREKKDQIERLRKEIDDARLWHEKEATYKILGAIKSLNKLGVSDINLWSCWLQGISFNDTNLKNATLENANCQNSYFIGVNFENARFLLTKFNNTSFIGCNLRLINVELEAENPIIYEHNLPILNFNGSAFGRTDFRGANLKNIVFEKVRFYPLNKFDGAIVGENWFQKLKEWQVEGTDELLNLYQIDELGILRKI